MKTIVKFSITSSVLALISLPALAAVTISSPANKSDVTSPFTLYADAVTCSSKQVSEMSYSIDNGSDLFAVKATSLEQKIYAGVGTHTLHVKAVGDQDTACVTDVTVNVTSETAITASGEMATSTTIPTGAQSNSAIQVNTNWRNTHDSGTAGSSSGSMSLVTSPSYSGNARKFVTKFSGSGGERYSDVFGEDTTSTNFVYDGWVYIASGSSIANLELDLNQVLENGNVMIFSFQCSGYAGVWEYGSNSGTIKNYHPKWLKSTATCNPASWAQNTWHHVQIASSRDNSGNITYQTVTLDGVQQTIGRTALGEFALHWGHVLQTNFQVDGSGSGSNTLYLDNLTVYHW